MLEALNDNVIVRPDKEKEKTQGGIILAETARRRGNEGVVVGVGPKCLSVKAKDRIIFGSYAGSEVVQGADDLLVMREQDILALVK